MASVEDGSRGARTSAAAPRCVPASPLGIATITGNAASFGSGGHDEYPGAAPDRGGVTRYPGFHPHLPPRQVSFGVIWRQMLQTQQIVRPSRLRRSVAQLVMA